MPKGPTRKAAALATAIANDSHGKAVESLPTKKAEASLGRIMYIERKAGNLTGSARIGRVAFSKTGRTLYYQGRSFKSLKGAGFKSNYYEVESEEDFWISGPRKDGADRLYGERVPVEIDEDVRVEYWREIRGQSNRVKEKRT